MIVDPFIAAHELKGARRMLAVLSPFLTADQLSVAEEWLCHRKWEIAHSERQLSDLAVLERKVRNGTATMGERDIYRHLEAEMPPSLDVTRATMSMQAGEK
jgi:hypothetical protein